MVNKIDFFRATASFEKFSPIKAVYEMAPVCLCLVTG